MLIFRFIPHLCAVDRAFCPARRQLRTLQDYALTVCCLANNMEKQDLEQNAQVYYQNFLAL
jgi:hypothetical protein